ncbi:MAG: hypothetical protein ACU0CO_13435 [Shimia sp.]
MFKWLRKTKTTEPAPRAEVTSAEPATAPGGSDATEGVGAAGGTIEAKFVCGNCGANPTTLRFPKPTQDDSVGRCKACGHIFGTYRDIRAQALAAAKRHAG